MEPRDLIVLTPSGAADPSLAIAACRAGARGVLDLEFASPPSAAAALARLARFAGDTFGAQLRPDSSDLFALLAEFKPAHVILAGADHPALAARVAELKAAGIDVLREAVSVAEAKHAAELSVSGIILKGHEAGGRVGADTSFVLLQKWRQYAGKNGISLPFWVRGGIGANTAAACLAGGARGVVLDSQVLLTRETPLRDGARKRLATARRQRNARPRHAARRRLPRLRSPGLCRRAGTREGRRAAPTRDASRRRETRRVARCGSRCRDRGPGRRRLARRAGHRDRGPARGEGADRRRRGAGHLRPLGEATRNGQAACAPRPGLAAGEVARHQVPDPARPDDARQRHGRVRRRVAAGGALPFLALALLRKAETEKLLAETKAKLGDEAVGRRHPRLRAARDPQRAARSDPHAQAAVRAHRRRPARPGARAGSAGHPDLPARPVAGPAQDVPQGRRPAVRLRGARVRRPRRPARELRAVGGDGRGAARAHRRQAGRRPARRVRRRHPRRPLRGMVAALARAARREGREGRRAAGHRVPVHEGSGRGRGDHGAVPGGSARVRRHGAARNRPRPRDPLRPDAVRRRVREREARAARAKASRRWKSASRWSG